MPTGIYDLPELVTLPKWADPSFLRSVSLVLLAVVLVGTWLVLRVLRRVIVKIVLTLILAFLAIGLWGQRAELRSCADQCSCTLFGQQVQLPATHNPRCDSK